MTETCASCVDPDFTVFEFDTSPNGFDPAEIDSIYIISFPRGQLNSPLDTTDLLIEQNPFVLGRPVSGTSSLNNDYVVESPDRSLRFEITGIDYTITAVADNCSCDIVENKSLRVNGILVTLSDPFQAVLLTKEPASRAQIGSFLIQEGIISMNY